MTQNDFLTKTENTGETKKKPDWFKIAVLVMLGFIVLHVLFADWAYLTLRDATQDLFSDLPDYTPPSDDVYPTEGMPEGSTS